MLQRTPYMTAEALGVEPNEHQALIAVLGKLERGELRHAPTSLDTFDEFGDACGFSMAEWDCGTVCCIGGWALRIAGHRGQRTLELTELYYPRLDVCIEYQTSYSKITPDQAAQALRNYLTHGEARWAEVLAP